MNLAFLGKRVIISVSSNHLKEMFHDSHYYKFMRARSRLH
jgi:hypothetical protein